MHSFTSPHGLRQALATTQTIHAFYKVFRISINNLQIHIKLFKPGTRLVLETTFSASVYTCVCVCVCVCVCACVCVCVRPRGHK